MRYKKRYSRPTLEIVEMKRTMLLSGSFSKKMDSSDLIEDYFDIL